MRRLRIFDGQREVHDENTRTSHICPSNIPWIQGITDSKYSATVSTKTVTYTSTVRPSTTVDHATTTTVDQVTHTTVTSTTVTCTT